MKIVPPSVVSGVFLVVASAASSAAQAVDDGFLDPTPPFPADAPGPDPLDPIEDDEYTPPPVPHEWNWFGWSDGSEWSAWLTDWTSSGINNGSDWVQWFDFEVPTALPGLGIDGVNAFIALLNQMAAAEHIDASAGSISTSQGEQGFFYYGGWDSTLFASVMPDAYWWHVLPNELPIDASADEEFIVYDTFDPYAWTLPTAAGDITITGAYLRNELAPSQPSEEKPYFSNGDLRAMARAVERFTTLSDAELEYTQTLLVRADALLEQFEAALADKTLTDAQAKQLFHVVIAPVHYLMSRANLSLNDLELLMAYYNVPRPVVIPPPLPDGSPVPSPIPFPPHRFSIGDLRTIVAFDLAMPDVTAPSEVAPSP